MDAPAILAALRAVAVPEKAAEMAAYMKNRFTFLGVATPVRRQTGKPYFRAGRIYNSSATATKKTSISDTAKNIKTLQETENGCLQSYYAH